MAIETAPVSAEQAVLKPAAHRVKALMVVTA
jgi:hypothetical protein